MSDAPLVEVADRLAINDLMYRYSRMVDFREWELFDQVFTADATCDYTSTGGIRGSAREVMDWLDRALSGWPTNLHFVTNVRIDFDAQGDGAGATCYFLGPMAHGAIGSQVVITNAGFYVDRLQRTADGWRMTDRECRMTLMLGSLPENYDIPD